MEQEKDKVSDLFGFLLEKMREKKAEDKKEVDESLRFYIPEENILEVLELVDDCDSKAGHYRLWERIGRIVPETKEGAWVLCTKSPMKPYVHKREEQSKD